MKEPNCSHCNDAGVVYLYNKDGDVVSKPCPKCKDELSYIRRWDGYYK